MINNERLRCLDCGCTTEIEEDQRSDRACPECGCDRVLLPAMVSPPTATPAEPPSVDPDAPPAAPVLPVDPIPSPYPDPPRHPAIERSQAARPPRGLVE